MYIRAIVGFESDLGLEAVAESISRELFGGVPFEGRDTGIRDEVPAIALARAVVGMGAIVSGYGGTCGYGLEVSPWDPFDPIAKVQGPEGDLELSAYFTELLRRVPGVKSAKSAI